MRRLTIALACGALALVPACGGDDEDEPITAPELTVPRETETTQQDTTAEQTAPAPTPEPGSGGTPAPAPQPQDSPQNDQPPPAGSPAERFEQFCEQNPGACG